MYVIANLTTLNLYNFVCHKLHTQYTIESKKLLLAPKQNLKSQSSELGKSKIMKKNKTELFIMHTVIGAS